MNALQASKLCDVTCIVSIACGRHCCYTPQALVDLFRGEQQKNVDFALLKAITSTHVEAEQGVLLIYNILCQYFVHLQDRIGSWLPFGLNIEAEIGLFHIHAHKDQYFFRYATHLSLVPPSLQGRFWNLFGHHPMPFPQLHGPQHWHTELKCWMIIQLMLTNLQCKKILPK